MSITIVNEQMYKEGVAQTTPTGSGSIIYNYAGMYLASNVWSKYALLLTCNTTTPISNLSLSITHAGTDNTAGDRYLGMYVTTAKDDTLLTSTGGDTRLRFSKASTDGGSWTDSGANNLAIGTVTKNIPTGTFYIYIVPYQTTYVSRSSIRSIQMTDGAPSATGTDITIYKATLNNQSATTAGTAALWYPYNTYISPYYYYTDSTCATGLANSKITIPAKTGYTFGGYYTSTGGSGTQYITAEGEASTTLYKLSGNRTLYAKWTAKTFTVRFDANEGAVTTESKTVTYASTYGTLPTPTRTGYTFSGWYTAKSGGTKVESTTTVSITAEQTLYARWTAKNFTVTFNANGGSVTPASKTVTYASTYGTLPTPTRTGYTFSGWYTASSGGIQVTAQTIVEITAAQTLYAQWQADGLVYLDTGTDIKPLQLYVEIDGEYKMLAPYLDTGTEIILLS